MLPFAVTGPSGVVWRTERFFADAADLNASMRPLRRILGVGFGLAMVFGGCVGVGILRLPATLAGALGNAHLIVLFWIAGGLYALLGAVSMAELAAMLPLAGGFYVYARRAFGDGFGFIVGCSDYLNSTAALGYASITAATFAAALWPELAGHARLVAVSILLAFTALQWVGLRFGSTLTRIISAAVGLMLLALVVACFATPQSLPPEAPLPMTAATLPFASTAMAIALVTALRAVMVTYDGWYSPIYLAEETTDPGRMLPRALIGGTVLVAVLYVLINVAILKVLPLDALAASALPAADAARLVLPRGGAQLVTVISLATVLSLINAILLMMPRILFAFARDGLISAKVASVSAGGSPRVALAVSSAAAIALVLSGSFEQIVALAAVAFLFCYAASYAALIVLRRREPELPRPYRAFGYPVSTAVMLLGCSGLLLAAVLDDPRSGLEAALLLFGCAALYAWLARRRHGGVPAAGAGAQFPPG